MKAVILAGGLGQRLRPFTEVLPKPLLPLGDKTLLEHQIERLKQYGFDDVFVATNYKSELIEAVLRDGSQLGVKVHISRETEPLGTAGPLKLLAPHLTEPFIMMNGDILTKLDFRRFYEAGMAGKSRLMLGTKIVTTPFRFGNVIVDDHGRVVDIEEKPDFRLEILAGIYFFRPEALESIPSGKYYGMDALIKQFLQDSIPISRYVIEDYWLDIGQVEDYSKARDTYAREFGPE